MIMAMVVVLPAPLPPSSPVIEPRGDRKRDVVDGRHLLVDLDEALDFDGRYGGFPGHDPQMWRARRGEARASRMALPPAQRMASAPRKMAENGIGEGPLVPRKSGTPDSSKG